MSKQYEYLELKSGIKIPLIQVADKAGMLLNIAPSEALKLLQNEFGEMEGEEAERIDNHIFYYADCFKRTKKMLAEIKNTTGIKTRFC